MPDDTSHIFICFSSKDEAIACEVVESLEFKGLKCWISSRDVPPGQNYQETIVQAIEGATKPHPTPNRAIAHNHVGVIAALKSRGNLRHAEPSLPHGLNPLPFS